MAIVFLASRREIPAVIANQIRVCISSKSHDLHFGCFFPGSSNVRNNCDFRTVRIFHGIIKDGGLVVEGFASRQVNCSFSPMPYWPFKRNHHGLKGLGRHGCFGHELGRLRAHAGRWGGHMFVLGSCYFDPKQQHFNAI